MRGSIIHHLCLLGYVDASGNANYDRINDFIVNIGSLNPRKVILNFLTYDELVPIVTQIKQMYAKESKRITR